MPPDTPPLISPRRSSFSSVQRRERLPWPVDRPFRILAIDGGGIKGIFPAAVLAQIEAGLLDGRSVVDHFDMIAGTSTGGILALGLAAGKSAQQLLDLYMVDGKDVFPPACWLIRKWRNLRGVFSPRYDNEALKAMLRKVLDDRCYADARTRLCIPAFEGHHGEVFIFKTPHHPDYRKDGYERMTTIGTATAAAPTFYAAVDSGGYRYVDGGVWANCPVMIGVVDALACFDIEPGQIRILSLGCGREPYLVDDKMALGGMWAWRKALFAAMDLQGQNAIGQARLLVGSANVVRLEPKPARAIELDDWIRAKNELPPLAKIEYAVAKHDIQQMFCYAPVAPAKWFWPPAESSAACEHNGLLERSRKPAVLPVQARS